MSKETKERHPEGGRFDDIPQLDLGSKLPRLGFHPLREFSSRDLLEGIVILDFFCLQQGAAGCQFIHDQRF